MAKEAFSKKEIKKGAISFPSLTAFEALVAIMIFIAMLEMFLYYVEAQGIRSEDLFNFLHLSGLVSLWNFIQPYARLIGYTLTVVFVFGASYAMFETSKIHNAMSEAVFPPQKEMADGAIVNERWERIEKYMESSNSSDWQLAIIEADIMLGDLLDVSGYKGESIGEKLKQVERSDFTTIDMAWDAHKVRNTIAHEGSSFDLSQREANRVIELYRQVFSEFHYI